MRSCSTMPSLWSLRIALLSESISSKAFYKGSGSEAFWIWYCYSHIFSVGTIEGIICSSILVYLFYKACFGSYCFGLVLAFKFLEWIYYIFGVIKANWIYWFNYYFYYEVLHSTEPLLLRAAPCFANNYWCLRAAIVTALSKCLLFFLFN